jgi:hypothetical protein
MEINKAIEILEALASGCSPKTGESIDKDSVLNERDVIRALQIAIDNLKANKPYTVLKIEIEEEDIKGVLELFKEQKQNPTPHKLAGFFIGSTKFINETIMQDQLYGKYQNLYQKGQLLDFFTQFSSKNNLINEKPYKDINFFQETVFNNLSEKAINQLKEKVKELGVQKSENLSEYVQNARVNHHRAYEPWTEIEKELLTKAMKYTNDLELLSYCFQRGKGSIESCGQRLIYESKNLQNGNQN